MSFEDPHLEVAKFSYGRTFDARGNYCNILLYDWTKKKYFIFAGKIGSKNIDTNKRY